MTNENEIEKQITKKMKFLIKLFLVPLSDVNWAFGLDGIGLKIASVDCS